MALSKQKRSFAIETKGEKRTKRTSVRRNEDEKWAKAGDQN